MHDAMLGVHANSCTLDSSTSYQTLYPTMPPKKESKNSVQVQSGEGADGVQYSQGDVDFIMACLKYPTGGTVHVS